MTGSSTAYVKTTEGLALAQEKFDAFLGPKIDILVSKLPEGHGVPEGLHDRLFFFTLFATFTALAVFIFTKIAGKVLCITTKAVKFVFGVVVYFTFLPLRILTCQVCKKRAPTPQTFSKPPPKMNGNGTKKKK